MTFATALLISVCLHGEGRPRILARLSRFFFRNSLILIHFLSHQSSAAKIILQSSSHTIRCRASVQFPPGHRPVWDIDWLAKALTVQSRAFPQLYNQYICPSPKNESTHLLPIITYARWIHKVQIVNFFATPAVRRGVRSQRLKSADGAAQRPLSVFQVILRFL